MLMFDFKQRRSTARQAASRTAQGGDSTRSHKGTHAPKGLHALSHIQQRPGAALGLGPRTSIRVTRGSRRGPAAGVSHLNKQHSSRRGEGNRTAQHSGADDECLASLVRIVHAQDRRLAEAALRERSSISRGKGKETAGHATCINITQCGQRRRHLALSRHAIQQDQHPTRVRAQGCPAFAATQRRAHPQLVRQDPHARAHGS